MTVPVQNTIEITNLPQGQTLNTLNFNITYVDKITINVSVNGTELLPTQFNVVGQVITFTPPITGIVGGSRIVVYLQMEFKREADLLQNSPIFANDLNKQLDRLTLMSQQLNSGINRNVRFPNSDAETISSELPIASSRANKALVFKADGAVGISVDNYIDQAAAAATSAALASVSATSSQNSANNSMIYSNLAKDWADKTTDVTPGNPSAKTWAQTASVLTIPNYSLQNNKFYRNQLNCVFGNNVLNDTASGAGNTILGNSTANSFTTAYSNTIAGHGSASAITDGEENAFFGASIGQSYNHRVSTAIGSNALSPLALRQNATCLGAYANVTGDNQLQLGGDLTSLGLGQTTSYAWGAVQNRSDRRDKADIIDTKLGLEFIKRLRPVDYKWDYRDSYINYKTKPVMPKELRAPYTKEQEDVYNNELNNYRKAIKIWEEKNNINDIIPDGTHKRKRYHHGLIAQEVKTVLDSLGIDFGGYQDHSINGGSKVLSIGYEELIAPLIKAIQELLIRVEALEKKK